VYTVTLDKINTTLGIKDLEEWLLKKVIPKEYHEIYPIICMTLQSPFTVYSEARNGHQTLCWLSGIKWRNDKKWISLSTDYRNFVKTLTGLRLYLAGYLQPVEQNYNCRRK
jgi:hypothetical protein